VPNPTELLARLDAIGGSLSASPHGLALIGLGSVGVELERLDAYSDLDFFAIVEDGYKAQYIHDLSWLGAVNPIAYQFRNTADGYKLRFADGIFCEFAVFELSELQAIPFSRGRIIWKQPHLPDTLGAPSQTASSMPPTVEHLVGEAITNLYVGLGRFHRGEKLSAMRFIQGYAVDRILDLAPHLEPEANPLKDQFANERRFESRFPQTAAHLPNFLLGYDRTPESALAILEFLEKRFEVSPILAVKIRELLP
jgi:hypothetical protein